MLAIHTEIVSVKHTASLCLSFKTAIYDLDMMTYWKVFTFTYSLSQSVKHIFLFSKVIIIIIHESFFLSRASKTVPRSAPCTLLAQVCFIMPHRCVEKRSTSGWQTQIHTRKQTADCFIFKLQINHRLSADASDSTYLSDMSLFFVPNQDEQGPWSCVKRDDRGGEVWPWLSFVSDFES